MALAGGDPGRVLDVAAGVGAFGLGFRDVVAVDLAVRMLDANPSNARTRANAEQMPFRDDCFSIAGCAFGINHVLHPQRVLDEMARVAPVVGVTTWLRPEPPYAPKRIVNEALAEQVGAHRSPAGQLLDRLSEQVGSAAAVTRLFTNARLEPAVTVEEVELPWPGVDAYLEYRLGMPSTPRPSDLEELREIVSTRVAALPSAARVWRAAIIVGVARR
jgi:SAM-dependent methyltransferase